MDYTSRTNGYNFRSRLWHKEAQYLFKIMDNLWTCVTKAQHKIKAKMAEFYLHNMALIDMNMWDPNARLGDLQLMAMASWMIHEELRATEVKRLMIRE